MILILLFCFIFFNDVVQAQPAVMPDDAGNPEGTDSDVVTLTNPLGKDVTPQAFIGRIISAVLGLVGSIALVMFIYGGFTWMTAAGSPEKVKTGQDVIVWAVIGLIIIFTAYALVRFVFTSLGVGG